MSLKMPIIAPAALNFGRFDVAVNEENATKPLQYGCCVQIGKSRSLQNPAYLTVKQHPDYRGFFIAAALPALSVSRKSCGAAGKKTAFSRSEARSPEKDIQPRVIPDKTRNATTAASNGYNDNPAMLDCSNERWGGGFVHPIANKQNWLVKVS